LENLTGDINGTVMNVRRRIIAQ